MTLKTKLTASITLLVLCVVLAANLINLAGAIREQAQTVYTHADFVTREIYGEMGPALAAAQTSAVYDTATAAGLQQFLGSLPDSPGMTSLFQSAIGYNGAIRDVALVAPDGTVVMDSDPLLVGRRQPQRELLSEIIQGNLKRQVKAVFGPETIYAVTLATQVGREPLGSITVGVDSVLMRQAIVAQVRGLAVAGGVMVLLAGILAWGLAGVALQPLKRISAQLAGLGAGAAPAAGTGDAVGRVETQIEHLGREMADARQVYSALQQNISQVLEGMEEGLLLFDSQSRCVMASAAAPRLLGREGAGLVGATVAELLPGGNELERMLRTAVEGKQPLAPREAERSGGARPLLVRLDLVRDGSAEPGTLVSLRDPEPVRRLEHELDVARRLSEVGRLTRGVAHEVKNPLNAMAVHLDLIDAKLGGEPAKLEPHVQVIRHEIERLDRVVRDFLDFSRPAPLHLAPTDLSDLASAVGNLVQAGAEAQGQRLRILAPHPGPQVWMDRDLVEQALLNLVNNGLQAMRMAGASGATLELEVGEQGRRAWVRVRDQGPGIAWSDRERIFDLYFTTREGGSGIGLAMAARTMLLHQGTIELEETASGASFLLSFPGREEEAVAG